MPFSEDSFDLIVLGSGGAGCAAACAGASLGLSVCLLEKDSQLGGGTADSLGTFWIANNHLAAERGLHDSHEESLTYARYFAGGQEVPANLEAYIAEGPRVLKALLATSMHFQLALNLPDYFYPAGPYSCADGRRMIEPGPTNIAVMGPLGTVLRRSVHNVRGVSWSDSVSWGGFANMRNWPADEVRQRAESGALGCGEALIAQFVGYMLKSGRVDIRLETEVRELVTEGGRVSGVNLANGTSLRARCGVVMATGGYEGSADLVKRFENFPEWKNPFGPRNTGDSLTLATAIGAAVSRIAVNNSLFIGAAVPGQPEAFFSVGLRGLPIPGAIAVNQKGQRFGDETQFQDMVMAYQHYDRAARRFTNAPAFMLFDDRFRQRYPVMNALPGQPAHPDIAQGATLAELAAKIGVDAAGLQATVERFNADVAQGTDTQFGRGRSAFSRNNAGDKELGANPQLAPVQTPPYYAVPLKMGGICSAGLLTDTHASVLDAHGQPMRGLYACGNTAAPTFLGVGYQGGSSIGAGIVFGWLAAEHAAANCGA